MQYPDLVFTHPDLDNEPVQADLRHGKPGEHCNVCDEPVPGIHVVLRPWGGPEERWCLGCFAGIADACTRPARRSRGCALAR